MLKAIIIFGAVVFVLLLGLSGVCFYLARKVEDERIAEKKAKEEREFLDSSLEDLVDKELAERYLAKTK